MILFLRSFAILMIAGIAAITAVQYSSHLWPSVEGVVEQENGTKRDQRLFSGRYATRYSYKVDGKDYASSRLAFSSRAKSVRPIGAKEDRQLRIGDAVKVYYAPFYPALSVLAVGASDTLIWWVAISILSFILLWTLSHVLKDPIF